MTPSEYEQQHRNSFQYHDCLHYFEKAPYHMASDRCRFTWLMYADILKAILDKRDKNELSAEQADQDRAYLFSALRGYLEATGKFTQIEVSKLLDLVAQNVDSFVAFATLRQIKLIVSLFQADKVACEPWLGELVLPGDRLVEELALLNEGAQDPKHLPKLCLIRDKLFIQFQVHTLRVISDSLKYKASQDLVSKKAMVSGDYENSIMHAPTMKSLWLCSTDETCFGAAVVEVLTPLPSGLSYYLSECFNSNEYVFSFNINNITSHFKLPLDFSALDEALQLVEDRVVNFSVLQVSKAIKKDQKAKAKGNVKQSAFNAGQIEDDLIHMNILAPILTYGDVALKNCLVRIFKKAQEAIESLIDMNGSWKSSERPTYILTHEAILRHYQPQNNPQGPPVKKQKFLAADTQKDKSPIIYQKYVFAIKKVLHSLKDQSTSAVMNAIRKQDPSNSLTLQYAYLDFRYYEQHEKLSNLQRAVGDAFFADYLLRSHVTEDLFNVLSGLNSSQALTEGDVMLLKEVLLEKFEFDALHTDFILALKQRYLTQAFLSDFSEKITKLKSSEGIQYWFRSFSKVKSSSSELFSVSGPYEKFIVLSTQAFLKCLLEQKKDSDEKAVLSDEARNKLGESLCSVRNQCASVTNKRFNTICMEVLQPLQDSYGVNLKELLLEVNASCGSHAPTF